MARTPRLVTAAALALVAGGCVSQEKYNALKLDRDRLSEQLATDQNQIDVANANRDAAQRSLDALKNGGSSEAALVSNLTNSNAQLQQQLADLQAKYNDSMNHQASNVPALPTALNNELTDFAAQNPDLVEFDSAHGVVKFKSDVTFDVGSANVKPEAKAVVDRFASILNSPAAANYELLVAGHTDNQPVSNPATIAAGNKDNWYLSAHRAIAVAKILIAANVGANRIGAVGYADQHPVKSNDTDAGRAKNRRVEVVILPTMAHGSPTMSASSHRTTPRKPATPPDMNKDNSLISQPPAMNK